MGKGLGWVVMLRTLVGTGLVGWAGSSLELASTTILWLILGAIMTIGSAGLQGQAAGLGRLIDDLEQLKSDLENFGQRDSS